MNLPEPYRLDEIEKIIHQWWVSYTDGVEFSPFPTDPDGGQARMLNALLSVVKLCKEYQQQGDTISLLVVETFEEAITAGLHNRA